MNDWPSTAGIPRHRSRARTSICRCTTLSCRSSERGVRRYMRVDPAISTAGRDVRQRPSTGAALIGRHGTHCAADGRKRCRRPDVDLRAGQRSRPRGADRALSGHAGLCRRNFRQRSIRTDARRATDERCRPASERDDAEAGDCRSVSRASRSMPRIRHMSSVIVGGTRQHGRAITGRSAARNTLNNMAAIGPDFKRRFVESGACEQRRCAADAGTPDEDERFRAWGSCEAGSSRRRWLAARRQFDLLARSSDRARPRARFRRC